MNARLMVSAAIALAVGTSALAEPSKTPPRDPAQPVSRPAEVVLASAEQVPVPAPVAEPQNPAPPKKRAARVTTCRCAGQTPQQ